MPGLVATHLETASVYWGQYPGTALETALAADDLNPHVRQPFYFHFMAAGKTLRVKLRYRSRLSHHPTTDSRVQDAGDIKELAMASEPERIGEPVMEPMLNPLQTTFDHGNPSSIPPSNMMPLTSAAIPSQRPRRKHSASLKRSASTPDVRGDAGMTLAEKRRNKLGYHRTSVACGMWLLRHACEWRTD